MPVIDRSARVPYSAAEMFDLVDDIERYPEFLKWCRHARITRREGNIVEATLDIGIAGFHKSFSTRNTLERPSRIDVALLSGPFRRLDGLWTFADVDGLCDVRLSVAFEMHASPLGIVLRGLFEEMARSQLNAFLDRARDVYG